MEGGRLRGRIDNRGGCELTYQYSLEVLTKTPQSQLRLLKKQRLQHSRGVRNWGWVFSWTAMAQRFFDKVPARAVNLLPNIRPTTYAVLGVLCSYTNEQGSCWPSIESLVKRTGISRRTIIRSLKKLCEVGLISRLQRYASGGRTSDLYQIIYHPVVGDTSGTDPVTPVAPTPCHGCHPNKNHVTRTNEQEKSKPKKKRTKRQKAREADYDVDRIVGEKKESKPNDDGIPF